MLLAWCDGTPAAQVCPLTRWELQSGEPSRSLLVAHLVLGERLRIRPSRCPDQKGVT